AGAKGILVNITAGMDFSIGEFEEVGSTIKEFASDNATVVVGTVIDPEMSGEMRVTIVATGLGHMIKEEAPRVKIVAETATRPDYKNLERPTVIRKKDTHLNVDLNEQDPDYLDIP